MNMYSQMPWLSLLGWSLVILWTITYFMYIAKELSPLAIWMPQNASAVGSVFDWLQSAADMRSGKNGKSGVIQHSIFPLWRYAAWVREVFVLLAVIPRPPLQFSLNRCEKLNSLMYPVRHLRGLSFNRGGLHCSIQVKQMLPFSQSLCLLLSSLCLSFTGRWSGSAEYLYHPGGTCEALSCSWGIWQQALQAWTHLQLQGKRLATVLIL